MLTGDMNSKMKFENVKSGFRMSSSVGGSNTGFGAHYEIEDDPNNVLDVSSDTIREKVNDWHDFVMSSRHAGVAAEFRRLVVQQRTHFKDVTGHILSKGDERWVHLRLPMEFEGNARSKTIPLPMSKGKVFEDPRQQDGELLWPEGMNRVQLDNFKKRDFKNDSYKIAGQLQQRPSPEGGGVLNTSWFKLWKEHLPEFEYVLQSWDTALTSSAESCYSACTTWGVFDRFGVKNIMLLSVFKEKVEYPELRKMATRLYNNYMDVIIDDPLGAGKKPNMILIEEKVSGYSLLADLMRANLPVMRFKPKGDKVGRCRLVSHIPENGLVWVTADAPGSDIPSDDAALFIESAELFPSSDVNDVIDSMSQAFLRLISAGWIMNKEDPPLIQNETEIWEKNRK
jgi:phage terminase large subunit-like protein